MSKYPRISSLYSSVGVATSGIVKQDSGVVSYITALNTNDADRFLQLFDQATLPITGDNPILVYPVYQKNGHSEVTTDILGVPGLVFDLGIVWGFSTVAGSYQPATPADCIISIRWS